MAGALWLQLYGYADARRMFMRAAADGSKTLGVLAGLGRTAARLGVEEAACAEYRTLLERWGRRETEPPEIAEARAYLERSACSPTGR